MKQPVWIDERDALVLHDRRRPTLIHSHAAMDETWASGKLLNIRGPFRLSS